MTSVQEFSAYHSHKYDGFTMAMVVNLVDNTTERDLSAAYHSLFHARRIGYRLHHNAESLGLRAFVPSGEPEFCYCNY